MKKILIGLAVVAVIGALFWKFKPQSKPASSEGTKTEEFSGTLVQAMKLGVPMKCTWQTNEVSGESYVKGQDMYLKTMMAGKTSYMVKQGDCVNTWQEGQKQGVKFCQTAEASPVENLQVDSGSYKGEGVDWNVEYKCQPDIFSGDRFNLPGDVQFTDLGAMMR